MKRWAALGSLLFACTAGAQTPEADVRAAIQQLAEATSYTWEVRSSVARPRDSRSAPFPLTLGVARSSSYGHFLCRGEWEAERGMVLCFKEPIETRVVRQSRAKAVASTPLGWLTHEEIEAALQSNSDRIVTHEGREVALRLALLAARSALSAPGVYDHLTYLLNDADGFEIAGKGEIVAVVGPDTVKKHTQARRAPRKESAEPPSEVVGRMFFRFRDGDLYEVELRLTDANLQASEIIRLSRINNTTVVPPMEAFERLLDIER